MVDLAIINSDDVEMVAEVKQYYTAQFHAAVDNEIFSWCREVCKGYFCHFKGIAHFGGIEHYILKQFFLAGIKGIVELAPDLYIDIPMLYDKLGKIIAPQIEKKVNILIRYIMFLIMLK